MTIISSGCSNRRLDAAPGERTPKLDVHATELCVTKGAIADRAITEPTTRAFALRAGGDAAQLTFTYGGDSDAVRELASGQTRRQVGLKLRAQDGCNLVYVMWRLDPKPALEVSVKINPGKRTHAECGAEGYSKVRATRSSHVGMLVRGETHTLRAEIEGDELYAWIDGTLVWQGALPEAARSLTGPAGLRSDNVKLDHIELAAPRAETTGSTCKRHDDE